MPLVLCTVQYETSNWVGIMTIVSGFRTGARDVVETLSARRKSGAKLAQGAHTKGQQHPPRIGAWPMKFSWRGRASLFRVLAVLGVGEKQRGAAAASVHMTLMRSAHKLLSDCRSDQHFFFISAQHCFTVFFCRSETTQPALAQVAPVTSLLSQLVRVLLVVIIIVVVNHLLSSSLPQPYTRKPFPARSLACLLAC